MAKSNVKRRDNGPGADYINTQRAMDGAINERLKSEADNDNEKLDPRTANNKTKVEHDPAPSQKKSGRIKH